MVRVEQCGRRLNCSTDDFCVPACCSGSWRLLVLALIASLLAAIYGTSAARCSSVTQAFLIVSVIFNAGGLILDGCLARRSSLGTILDDRPRKGVATMVSIRLILAIFDATIAILGVLAVTVGLPDCPEIDSRQSLYRALLGAAIASVALTVLFALTAFTCWCCGFVGADRKYASLDEALEASAKRWTKRCRGCAVCCCCAGCCGQAGDLAALEDTFETVGLVLAGTFESAEALRLTASDIAAGLALVRAVQKDEERAKLIEILKERKQRLRNLRSQQQLIGGAAAAGESVSIGVVAAATATTSGEALAVAPASSLPAVDEAKEASSQPSSVLSPQAATSLAGGVASRGSILPSRITYTSGGDRAARPSSIFKTALAARTVVAEERTRAIASALKQRRFAQYTAGSVALDVTDPAQRHILMEAAHYSSYALSAYGWLMYAFTRFWTWPCRLPTLACVFKVGDTVEACCKSPFCTIDHPRSFCACVGKCCCSACAGGAASTANVDPSTGQPAPPFSISLSRDPSNPFSAHHYKRQHGTAEGNPGLVSGDVCGCNEVALRHILQEALANDALARQGLADAATGSRLGSHLVAAGFAPVAIATAHQNLTGRRSTADTAAGAAAGTTEAMISPGGAAEGEEAAAAAEAGRESAVSRDSGFSRHTTTASEGANGGERGEAAASSGGAVGVGIHDALGGQDERERPRAPSSSSPSSPSSILPPSLSGLRPPSETPAVGAPAPLEQPGNLPARPLFHKDDVLYETNENSFFTTPWFVAVDRPRNALVISIRGTLSLTDCITDAVAQPHSIRKDILKGKFDLDAILKIPAQSSSSNSHHTQGPFVHGGMWASAKNILMDLLRHNLLETAYAGPGARPLPDPNAVKPFLKRSNGATGQGKERVMHMPSYSSLKFGAALEATTTPTEGRGRGAEEDAEAEAEAAAVPMPAPSVAITVDDESQARQNKKTPLLSSTNRRSTPPTASTGDAAADDYHSSSSLDAAAGGARKDAAPQAMCDGRQASLQLIVCGHSLGAGTAALLSLLLRPYFPNLRCFAYAPPGALVSPDLARVMEGWTVSCVVGKDLVPRMSLATLNGLLGEMIEYSSRCKVSKNLLMATAGVACCADVAPDACRPCCSAKVAKTCCFAACCCCGVPDKVCAGQDCMRGFDIGVGTLSPTADRESRAKPLHDFEHHPDLRQAPVLASSELLLPPGSPLPPTEFAAALEALRQARAKLEQAPGEENSAGSTGEDRDRDRDRAASSGEDEYYHDVRGTATDSPRRRYAVPAGTNRPSIVGHVASGSRPSIAPGSLQPPMNLTPSASARPVVAAAPPSAASTPAGTPSGASAEGAEAHPPSDDDQPASSFQASKTLEGGTAAGADTITHLLLAGGAQAQEKTLKMRSPAKESFRERLSTSASTAAGTGAMDTSAEERKEEQESKASQPAGATVVVLAGTSDADGAPSRSTSSARMIRQSRRLLLSQSMYIPGRVLHLVKVDKQPSDVCSLACRAICGPSKRTKKLGGREAAATTGASPYAAADEGIEYDDDIDEEYSSSRYYWADLFAAIFCFCFRKLRVVYEPRWARRRNFTRILVSSHAIAHHLPDVMQLGLQSAVADMQSGLAFGLDEPPSGTAGAAGAGSAADALHRQASVIGR